MSTQPGHSMRHALMDEEQRSRARTDASTFRLQQQFMRAHGTPSGQLTTLVTSSSEGGVFLCTRGRQQ